MKRKLLLIVLSLLLISGLITFFAIYNRSGFSGGRAAAPDFYRLDAKYVTGTDRHTLELESGDVLQIQFETEKGSMTLEIKAPDGTMLYTGSGKSTPRFTVNISESGAYSVTVRARRAEGTICIEQKQPPQ